MKDWHIRHRIFHQIFKDTDMGDDLSKETIIEEFEEELIVKRAVDYPSLQTRELYYPGKSYAVAVTFAKLLEIHFQEDFLTSLNDPLLLYENDPYFVPYQDEPELYDKIIQAFPFELVANPSKASANFQKTCEYFQKEFLLHESTRIYAPAK